jgi:glycosyltransferase involved in cell wall biosynthesis
MRLVGIMPARNEAWVIGYSARAALQWVDHLVVLDHASTDGTSLIIHDIAFEQPSRITWLEDPEPEWREMAHRQRMLEAARLAGADCIAVIDADEVLTATMYDKIHHAAEQLAPTQMAEVPLHNLWRNLDQYRCDKGNPHGRQWAAFVFCDHPNLHWEIEEQFHHRQPVGASMPVVRDMAQRDIGGMLHLQRASWRRALARQARYKLLERIQWPERELLEKVDYRYSSSVDEAGLRLRDVPDEWWPKGLDRGIIDLDAEPWEEDECRRLVDTYGRERFAGLDLFGVVSA